MKRIISLVFLFIIISSVVYAAPEISAEYACVMEKATGSIIYEYNGYQRHSMASTTKIMTAILALDTTNPEELVTISRNADLTEGSSAYIKSAEKIKMIDLLYGLMLNSGNDAAVAIAEYIAGTEKEFAVMMTKKAKELGAADTAFANASGLDEENHYTTAADLAKITRYALNNDTFRQIVSSTSKTSNYSGGTLYFHNHNKMLKMYEGCTGVKTGFTKKTGRCLVSSAMRDGIELICVTLRAPDDWNDHKKLLDFGFENVTIDNILDSKKILKYVKTPDGVKIPALVSKDIYIPVIKNNKKNIEVLMHTVEEINSSIPYGEKIGECEIFVNSTLYATEDIISGEEYIEPTTMLDTFLNFWRKIFNVQT